MADLPESVDWTAGIYQLETSDPVLGGPDGIDNLQAKQLANRTRWLKDKTEQIDEALALKASLDSPAITGNPTAPTQGAGNNSTRLANTAFVQAAIAALVASSPAALDTLNELAAALGNDPNFATTITNALALKAPLASPGLTGNPTAPTPAQFDNDSSIATTGFVQRALGNQAGAPVIATADMVLTAAQAGLLFVTAAGTQFTLPPLSDVADGSCYHFLFNYGGGSVKANGSQVIQAGGVSANVYNAGYAERLTLVKRSNAWYAASGGIGVDGFLSSQGANGWSKDPNGIIEQWGTAQIIVTDGVSVAADVAFNIAFPNACWNFQASLGIYAASGSGYTTTRQGVNFGNPTKTGCWGRVFNDSGSASAASTRLLYWRARGY
ncbi:hypothetical protein BGP82_12870 [Pseudomonas putida]|uniref:Putative tail fiber protein gp53-like C-terminal domain-containing protein n=1 Tax=Pseudomonas putida TaxID=303 RepID=A0A2S3WLN5_PSEPU|nr:hypothetical protein [Pseudomonas putida]POG02235.1 hypothetical protein BGP82_12870 [Pseudomonas putida]